MLFRDRFLAYLAKLDIPTTFYNPLDETHKNWDQTTRGLTQTSQLIIAVAAAAVTGGVGSFATVGMAALSAGAGSLATTAAISATNASMNTGGNFFGSLGHVTSVTLKDTTSSDSLRSAAISAAAAGLAVGVSNAADINGLANSASKIGNPALRVVANTGVATARVGINTASYVVADSVISGNSFSETFNQDVDLKFLAAQIIGEVNAKEIGTAYHSDKISQPEQLAMHAVLGCAMGAAAGGDCGSGAIAGASSEYLADAALKNRHSPQGAILIGQGTGATTALIASMIRDEDDGKTARNVQVGSLVGANAAVNNATMVDKKGKILKVENDGDTGVYVDKQNGGKAKDIWVGATELPDSFKGFYDPDSKYSAARIHFDTSINIEGLSQAIASNYTEAGMALDFRHDNILDLKTSLINLEYTGNPMDGIIRQSDGMIISVRSAGNQTFGQAIIRNGSDPITSMQSAGAYQQTNSIIDSALVKSGLFSPYGNAPYWGEETATGRDVITGYQGANYPVRRTENLNNTEAIIRHYIEVKK